MSSATEKLTRLVAAEDRFDYSHAELRETQLEALNERFQERKDRIKLLGHRAREAGIDRDPQPRGHGAAAVPAQRLQELPGKLPDRGEVGPARQVAGRGLALSDQSDRDLGRRRHRRLDRRLQAKGHYVSCSSGTTGKSAMLLASDKDMDWSRKDTVNVFAWGSGVQPARDRRMMGLAPTAAVPKNLVIGQAQQDAFGDPAKERFRLPIPPITVGSLTKMVVLRKKIADGTALPENWPTSSRPRGSVRRRSTTR